MAQNDIELKLRHFLSEHKTFTHEMHVVYLLVEIRKLIEHGRDAATANYQTIKFYCDWTLHTEKSQSFRGMETVFEEIFQDCKKHIEGRDNVAQKLVDFLYFSALRDQMRAFFDEHDFDKHILENQNAWVNFVKNLLGVLTDQPIKNIPSENLKEIYVSGVNPGAASLIVVFTSPIKDSNGQEMSYYKLINGF